MEKEVIDLIEKYLQNKISATEKEKLIQWCHREKLNQSMVSTYYARQWNAAAQNQDDAPQKSKKRVWRKLKNYLSEISPTRKKIMPQWAQIAGIAAIALLLLVLGYSLHIAKNDQAKELIVKVENGQKANITLPDGSSVWLNSASELRYPNSFGKKKRNLTLIGEAYFEVKSDPEHPFIVKTRNNLHIKALGTKFNVKSYPEDDEITSTLLEGKIDVRNRTLSQILYPDEQLVFNPAQNTFRKAYIENKDEAIFWMTNQFVFEEESLESIAKILERMYNVKFKFTSPEIKHIKYSGKIKNNSMENVLNLITTVSPLSFSMTDSCITFRKK